MAVEAGPTPTDQNSAGDSEQTLEPLIPLPTESTSLPPHQPAEQTFETDSIESNAPTEQETAEPIPSDTASETPTPVLDDGDSLESTEPTAVSTDETAAEPTSAPATAESAVPTSPLEDQNAADPAGTNSAAIPILKLSHTRGPAGVKITLTGTDFGPVQEVPVYWENPSDGSTHWMGSAGTLEDGSFRMDVGVPTSAVPGQYLIKAVIDDSIIAYATYEVITHAVRIDVESGERGSTVVVSGEGLLPGDEISVKWDSIFAWPLITDVVGPDGTYSVAIKVPEDAAIGYSTIHVHSGWLSFELPFQVTTSQRAASISISPTSGQPGTKIAVTGRDFKPGQRVNIRWGGEAGPILGFKDASSVGDFSGVFLIPTDAKVGVTQVVLEDGTSFVVSTFTVLVPPTSTISLSPSSAKPGERVVVTATNFRPGERVNIRWGSASGPILGYKNAASTGTISGAVVVPSGAVAGATRIYLQATSATIFAGFTVISLPIPTATVSPVSALPGSRVTIIGTNFKPGQRVDIRWGSISGSLLGYKYADSTGKISGVIVVPATAPAGTTHIYLQASTGSASIAFTVKARPAATVTLSPTSALPGTKVIVTGANFKPGERVNIRWGSATGTVLGYKNAASNGTFSGVIVVPSNAPAGSTRIYLQSLSGSASASFTVKPKLTARISISYNFGTYGDVEVVQGSNYLPGEIVTILFPGNVAVARVTVRSDGTFSTKITVPKSAATGYNTITARGGTSGLTASVRYDVFEFLWAKVSITARALPGAKVTFSGSGFRPNERIYLGINGKDTGLYVISSSTGTISGYFTVPGTAATGNHIIQFANHDFTYYAETVLTVIPWQTPRLYLPASTGAGQIFYFSGSGFGPDERVEVYDLLTERYLGAGVTDATGNFVSYGIAPPLYGGYTDFGAIGLKSGRVAITSIRMLDSQHRDISRSDYFRSAPSFDQTVMA